ncbi:DsbA family protein [Roseivivax isoporae]|uniref:Thiol-disulfide oxidoreductase n=1 Tax=Roseivivax isoporae LMG 25204 TaxID=1449351 RepID=X7F4W4_9RHOB|nr:DsbA family protein [Roseivivax isoporae]ETX27952.1 thiol-disulfide oxidoreductase [Roseivivax isoporae LMG 25204]
MKRTISTAALAAILAGGGFWFAGLSAPGGAPVLPGAAMAQDADAPAEEIEITDMAIGAEDAPVEVIEYASYTCPHCRTFHETVFEDLKENYVDTGQVRFVYREVYFDKYGMWASLIARCGDDTQRFFGISDLIYDGQEQWTRAGSDAAIAEELRKIGRLAGLSNDQLEGCLTDGAKLRALVDWYQANATEDDVTSTPTFIIDGEKHSNMGYDDFSAILDEKIAAAE